MVVKYLSGALKQASGDDAAPAVESPRHTDIVLFGRPPNAYECALPWKGLWKRRTRAYYRPAVLSCGFATSPCADIHW